MVKGIGWWIGAGVTAGLGLVLAYNVAYREHEPAPEPEPEPKLSEVYGVKPEDLDCFGRDRWRCLEDEARRRCGVDNYRILKSKVEGLALQLAVVCINEPSNEALR